MFTAALHRLFKFVLMLTWTNTNSYSNGCLFCFYPFSFLLEKRDTTMRILPTLLLGLSHQFCPDECNCSVKKAESNDFMVDCSNKNLNEFPANLSENNYAVSFNFEHNEIKEFTTNIIDVESIKSLNLSNNKLTVFLDPQRKKWDQLENLDLR